MWINSKGIVNFTILFQRPERDTNVDMGKLGTMNDNGERLSSFEQLSFWSAAPCFPQESLQSHLEVAELNNFKPHWSKLRF